MTNETITRPTTPKNCGYAPCDHMLCVEQGSPECPFHGFEKVVEAAREIENDLLETLSNGVGTYSDEGCDLYNYIERTVSARIEQLAIDIIVNRNNLREDW
jgi:hypothetical protein